MKITVLNGSPRPNGNTAGMVKTFREAAETAGHTVTVFEVCKMNVKGCMACEYCHERGQGECIQKDDMKEIYKSLQDTDMLILASPIRSCGAFTNSSFPLTLMDSGSGPLPNL